MTKAQALAKRKREIEGEIENLQAILAGIEEAERVLLAPKPAGSPKRKRIRKAKGNGPVDHEAEEAQQDAQQNLTGL